MQSQPDTQIQETTEQLDDEATRAAYWQMMLERAGTHPDPNPLSKKARPGGNAHLRKADHAFSRFKL